MKKINLKYLAIIIFVIICFNSCKKENEFQNISKIENEWKPMDVNLERLLLDSLFNNSSLRVGDGINDLLGYGYDVTQKYANSTSARFAIFNVDTKLFKDDVDVILVNTTTYSGNYGGNAQLITKKISDNINATRNLYQFGGTLFRQDDGIRSFMNNYVYGNYNVKRNIARLQYPGFPFLNSNAILSPKFVQCLNGVSNENIVSYFGTHAMIDIYVGGKLEFNFNSQTSNTNQELAANAGLKVIYSKIFGNQFNTGFISQSNINEDLKNYNQSFFYNARGGNQTVFPTVASNVNLYQSNISLNITPWFNSVTRANSVLIDFPSNGLIPVYEYFPHTTRGATGAITFQATPAQDSRFNSLKTYITNYMNARKVTVYTPPPPPPPPVAATVYKHRDNAAMENNIPGYAINLVAGSYTRAQLIAKGIPDNDISGIKVTPGYQVTLYDYDNFDEGINSQRIWFNNTQMWLGYFYYGPNQYNYVGFNDRTTSIKIVKL